MCVCAYGILYKHTHSHTHMSQGDLTFSAQGLQQLIFASIFVLVLMNAVRRFDKLESVLQRSLEVMSEHCRSVISERLKKALTAGRDFHEQSILSVIEGIQEQRDCGITTLGKCLHIDLCTGTCSWLSIMKANQSKWFHILASTFCASKQAWTSSSLHGWCEIYFAQMDNVVILFSN